MVWLTFVCRNFIKKKTFVCKKRKTFFTLVVVVAQGWGERERPHWPHGILTTQNFEAAAKNLVKML